MIIDPLSPRGARRPRRRLVVGVGLIAALLFGLAWANSGSKSSSSGIKSAGSTVISTGCAGRPARSDPSRDEWLVLSESGELSTDDLAGTRTHVADLDLTGLADAGGRLDVSARLDGGVAWILATHDDLVRVWRVQLDRTPVATTDLHVPSGGANPVQDWDVSEGVAAIALRGGAVREVSGADLTGSEVLVPPFEGTRTALRRAAGGTWLPRPSALVGGPARLDWLPDQGTGESWDFGSEVQLTEPVVDGSCLWLTTGDGCEPGVAAFRAGHPEAVVARVFDDACLSTMDVGDGRVVVGTGQSVKEIDAKTGRLLRSTRVFDCGDGFHVLVRNDTVFAADDCDGRAVQLGAGGEVVTDLDLFAREDEPTDFTSDFEWPWLVGGATELSLYHLSNPGQHPSNAPEDVTLLIPV